MGMYLTTTDDVIRARGNLSVCCVDIEVYR